MSEEAGSEGAGTRPSLPSEDAFFLSRLKRAEAAPLTSEVKLFLSTFRKKTLTMPEQRRAIAIFLDGIYAASLQNEAFSNVTDDDELEFIREGWEKLVMRNVCDLVFGAPGTDEHKMQSHLNNKVTHFAWVHERHFDIPYSFGDELMHAQNELAKINEVKSPKEKMAVLLTVFELAVAAIRRKQDAAGNDQLLPVIILIIIRSKAPDIISNVNYILRFRSKYQIEQGQVQYCITTMMSAITFIYNLTLDSLTISPEERHQRIDAKLPTAFISKPGANKTGPGVPKPRGVAGSQSHASNFINNNQATTAINDLASNFFAGAAKVLGSAGSVIKSTAETVGGTVDGFTQGLIAGFKEEGIPSSSTSLPAGDMSADSVTSLGNVSPTSTSTPIAITSLGPPRAATDDARSPTSHLETPPNLNALSQSPSAKVGTAFAQSLKASRQAAVKLFTPVTGAIADAGQSVFAAAQGSRAGTPSGAVEAEEAVYRAPLPPPRFPVRTSSQNRGGVLSEGDEDARTPGARGAHFEHRLSNAEKYVLEDYEMQLALALSLSEASAASGGEVPTGELINFGDADEDAATSAWGSAARPHGKGVPVHQPVQEDEDDEEEEIPLESRRRKDVDTGSQRSPKSDQNQDLQ